MRTRGLSLLIWGGLLLFAAPLSAQCLVPTLWTSSRDDNIVRQINLNDMSIIAEHEIDLGPGVVVGVPGIAFDEFSDQFFLLIQQSSPPGAPPTLGTWEPSDGSINLIGSVVVAFDCLDFDPDGVPHTLSRGTATPPQSFCELSLLVGSPLDLCTITNPDDGQTIAFHPPSGNFFQANGDTAATFREVTTLTSAGSPCDVSDITLDAVIAGDTVSAICWSDNLSQFLWATGGVDGDLYSVTVAGVATPIGTLANDVTDMTTTMSDGPCGGSEFRRADANGDGGVDISDAVFVLGELFVPGSPAGQCQDADDVNDDGTVDISDAVYLLGSLFIPGSPAPPDPGSLDCGLDPTVDMVDCGSYTGSCP